MGGPANKRCSAGAGDVCPSDGCGLAILTLSGRAPHITAGAITGISSPFGMNGDFTSSTSPSDCAAFSMASKEKSVNSDDGSHDESVS